MVLGGREPRLLYVLGILPQSHTPALQKVSYQSTLIFLHYCSPNSSLVSASAIRKLFTMIISYLFTTKPNEFLSVSVLLQKRGREGKKSFMQSSPFKFFPLSLQGVPLSIHSPFISSLVETTIPFICSPMNAKQIL